MHLTCIQRYKELVRNEQEIEKKWLRQRNTYESKRYLAFGYIKVTPATLLKSEE
jgi:uncharacterized protein YggL (DUF469 family)